MPIDYKKLYEKTLAENDKLKKENEKLKENEKGIMEEEDTGHILGCNSYEKFCQAICELNYNEKWITELKEEIHKKGHCDEVVETYEKGIMKRNKEIFELKKEIEKLKEFALGYWSGGQLGNCSAWDRPDEWQEQLDTLP